MAKATKLSKTLAFSLLLLLVALSLKHENRFLLGSLSTPQLSAAAAERVPTFRDLVSVTSQQSSYAWIIINSDYRQLHSLGANFILL